MKCPSCGKDVPEDANYCPYCGTRLQEKKSGELAHEELAELRHNELIAIVFSIAFMGFAILFAYMANLSVVEIEWTCVVKLYGSCIW